MTKCIGLLLIAMVVCSAAARSHVIEIGHSVPHPEEGLLLGNGDLSCSIYQTADDLVFRLGKSDVWDRRFDYSKQPKPPTDDEICEGVLKCGWHVTGWDASNVEEQKKMPKGDRLLELTKGKTALRAAPFPNPKPTGELRFRLPRDLGLPERVGQRLVIEEGLATVDLYWKGGAFHAHFEAVADPEENVLAVEWRMDGWNDSTQLNNRAPIYAALYRWADPDYDTFMQRHLRQCPQWPGFSKDFPRDAKPLPPPQVLGQDAIEQTFYPDPLFPGGFRYRMTLHPLVPAGKFWRPDLPSDWKDAYLVYIGDKTTTNGAVAVSVKTSRDDTLDPPSTKSFAEYKAAAKAAGREYWSASAFAMPGDSFLEDLWYSTYHARRCVLKAGCVPPGLFFPSAIDDYSRWNGDYHANYNYQSIFFGDLQANRPDQALAYMDGVEFSVPLGRKIARDYYNCRGCFFPLQMFPCHAPDDYFGTLPLGRMIYMTGWMTDHYWDYYQYTRDREFLAKRGYPMLKDTALFYNDFLKKAPSDKLPPELNDGLYHVFPSVEAESGFRNALDFCDKGQGVAHVRHTLWAAIQAARLLGVDEDLQKEWQEKLDNLVGIGKIRKMSPYERYCTYARPADEGGIPWKPSPKWDGRPGKRLARYPGVHNWVRFVWIHENDKFIPERDFDGWKNDLKAWRHENGLVWAMGMWERVGGWTESLSCMAPFQEMVMQSWDGAIRLFPRWPKDKDVRISGFRAQGAFLVDAVWKDGRPGRVVITSEKGADCHFHGNWKVFCKGMPVRLDRDAFGRNVFKTVVGGAYEFK